ncbi:MAG: DUF202 domain-containing protein [Deltaproteobacteria bacterium]|nr:MAG: DUF202 domain-containing protein [Deltaproteobacteria bacterium]
MNEDHRDTSRSTELARERSREAADRTLMAWIRTSLALIGFGFGVGKVYYYLGAVNPGQALDPIHSARVFGGAFVALGTFGLLAAALQHWQTLKRIQRKDFVYSVPWPLTELVTVVLFCIGVYALMDILR